MTKRELNQHTAAVLARVTTAEDLVVTERGTPRWRLSLVRGDDTTLARLEREGRYTPAATEPMPWLESAGRRYEDAEIGALLDDLRGER